jgi:putative transposase
MINELQDRFPIAWLVKRMNVARSGYCSWLQRQANPGPRATEDDEIAGAIERVCRAHRRRYGSPRIHQELREAGRTSAASGWSASCAGRG